MNNSTNIMNNSTNATQISWTDQLFKTGSFMVCCVMLLITLIGFLGNLASIYVFSRPHLRSSINVLLLGLACSDFLMLSLGTFCFFPIGYYKYFQIQDVSTMAVITYVSKYVFPLAMMAQTASVWILILITVERYLAVCHPFRARVICITKNAFIALCVVVSVSVAYNFCRFWDYDVGDYKGMLYPKENLKSNPLYVKIYTLWMYLIFMFTLPFDVLTVLNVLILIRVNNARKERSRLTSSEHREHRTSIMLLIIIFIFLMTNSMAFVLAILEVSLQNRISAMDQPWFFFITDISNLLVEVNAGANFIIYYLRSAKYRKEWKTAMQNLCGRCCAKAFWSGHPDDSPMPSFVNAESTLLGQHKRHLSPAGSPNCRKKTFSQYSRYPPGQRLRTGKDSSATKAAFSPTGGPVYRSVSYNPTQKLSAQSTLSDTKAESNQFLEVKFVSAPGHGLELL